MSPLEAMTVAAYEAFWRDDESSLLKDMTPEQREASLMEWRGIVRAALAALRDNGVTEGMVEAWVIAPVDDAATADEQCAIEFRAMLDAALGEG